MDSCGQRFQCHPAGTAVNPNIPADHSAVIAHNNTPSRSDRMDDMITDIITHKKDRVKRNFCINSLFASIMLLCKHRSATV